jgi:mannose/fructose-specific phosphotransferase system component IIA
MSREDAIPEVKGVLVTHGAMSFGMVDAVKKIAGIPDGVIVAVSNEGKGVDELVRAVVEVAGDDPVIIFTDLQTGSCALAARFACRQPENRRILFGVNLPMLIDFVFHRTLPLDDLTQRLIAKGREAIVALEPMEWVGGDRSLPR